MKIVLISSMCSEEYYESLKKQRKKSVLDSSQKFFQNYIHGFALQKSITVECVCIPPISRSTLKKLYVKQMRSVVDGITYWHIGCINIPVFKTIFAYHSILKTLKRIIKTQEDVIILDPLIYEAGKAAIKFCNHKTNKNIGLLTDLPDFASANDKMSGLKHLIYNQYNRKLNQMLSTYDSYIFLTKSMNDYVNEFKKPWMLMECIVDSKTFSESKIVPISGNKKVVYAGKLHREFGIDLLLSAIKHVNSKCEFHFYGDGNMTEEIIATSKYDNRVFYHGIVSTSEIIEIESNATILINPRRASDEFTKFSFPSKTAEYMSVGKPIIMFKLPGIPDEYDKYLLYPEEENELSLAKKIDDTLKKSTEELNRIGNDAKNFIFDNKSSEIQANRTLDFISTELLSEQGKQV